MTPQEKEKLVQLLTDKEVLVQQLRSAMIAAREDVLGKAQAEAHGESQPHLAPLIQLFRKVSAEDATPVLFELLVHGFADAIVENNKRILRILDVDASKT